MRFVFKQNSILMGILTCTRNIPLKRAHINTYIYIHTSIHIYIYTYIYIYMYTHIHACARAGAMDGTCKFMGKGGGG